MPRNGQHGEPAGEFEFFSQGPDLDVSIVIPVRNERRFITRCLDTVLAQDIKGRSFEIIVVDGESDDGTRDILEKLAASDRRVRLLDNPRRRVSVALNIGFRAARGETLVRMDAHSLYERDYVSQCLRILEETGCDAVGGAQQPAPGEDTPQALAVAAFQSSRLGLGGAAHRRSGLEGPAKTLWLGAFRRAVIQRAGGFDERLFRTEDNDFFQRMRASGGTLWVSNRIKARYICRPTLRELTRQYFVTGTELLPTVVVNPRALSLRHFVPAVAILSALGLVILSSFGNYAVAVASRVTLGGLALVYFGGSFMEAVRLRRITGTSGVIFLAAAFPLVHTAYAFGTLFGLPKMTRRLVDRLRSRTGAPSGHAKGRFG